MNTLRTFLSDESFGNREKLMGVMGIAEYPNIGRNSVRCTIDMDPEQLLGVHERVEYRKL